MIRSSRRATRAQVRGAAVVSILAPVAALLILLFAGGTVPPCFRGVGITADVYLASCG